MKLAAEAAEWTALEDADILGTCAKLAASVGNEEAVARYSAAARRAMMLRPLQNSVLVEAAATRLGEQKDGQGGNEKEPDIGRP